MTIVLLKTTYTYHIVLKIACNDGYIDKRMYVWCIVYIYLCVCKLQLFIQSVADLVAVDYSFDRTFYIRMTI